MAVSPRIHWVNLSFLAVLDVLSRRSEEVETHHLALGLHPRSDGTECAAVAGRDPGHEVCGLRIYREKGRPILTIVCVPLATICDRTDIGADSRNCSYSGAHSRNKNSMWASAGHLSGCPITNLLPELELTRGERYSRSIFLAVSAGLGKWPRCSSQRQSMPKIAYANTTSKPDACIEDIVRPTNSKQKSEWG